VNYLFVLYLSLIFTPAPPLREVRDLGPVLTDVESHLNPGHPYRDADPLTWTHEGLHGVNSLLRNKHGCPAFYVLENRCVLLQEPKTTLSKVAAAVPVSLRGRVYRLYLIEQQRYWQNEPSYCFDELTAYAASAEAAKQRKVYDRGATDFALELTVYSTCVPMVSKSNDPRMKAFLRLEIERVVNLSKHSDYLDQLRAEPDAKALRAFMVRYYGSTWTKKVLGF